MQKKTWFDIFYSVRHVIAILSACLGLFIIKQVTLLLFVKPYQPLDIITLSQLLWHSNDLFLRMILVFNLLIKPLVIYTLVIFIFCYVNEWLNPKA